ncbi:MAG: 4'-phosphopantetheinyl transferase superfamily protein [Candidatus Auribacterota bacterium]|jgi:holo-[acyl-carrier protein] synthase|nr:4'-phosphopantetheinyl transferase superfamily protein [Candidatus Auribacterota bacterium]
MADSDADGKYDISLNLRSGRVYGVGIDIIEVDRVTRLIENHSTMLQRIFTASERNLISSYAKSSCNLPCRIFAMKEAILKSCAVGWQEGVAWSDMEITGFANCHEPILTGKLAEYIISKNIQKVLAVSSATGSYAVAQAIALM